MSKILILCPTRARPDNAKRLTENLAQTSWTTTNYDLVFCIDKDDPKLADYLYLGQNPGFYYFVGGPMRLGPWLNSWVPFLKKYDVVGFLGDDVLARTYGWDKRIISSMTENGIVYGNDGFQGQALPTSVFMDARMVEKAGYMVYPELTHLYIDNHWKAWGEKLGTLTYLDDVLLEHLHPHAGKAEDDEVYRNANSPEMYSADGRAYSKFVNMELPELVNRIG